MSKTKSTTKAEKPSKSDVLSKVKTGGVTKPSKDAKASKEVAKKVIEKEEKKSKKDKKKVKEPTPEPSSSEEEEESSESDSSESESEVETKKPAVNGTKKAAPKDDSSDSESSESEDEAPAPKKADKKAAAPKTNGVKAAAKKDDSSDESDSDSDDEGVTTTVKPVSVAKAEVDSSDESDSSDDEKEAKPMVPSAAADASASSDSDSASSDSDSSESEEEEEKPAKVNKRKTEAEAEPVAKKARTEVVETSSGEEAKKNLFVGNLSWNIDEAWLRETFEEHGELSGVRVMYDKATNRAKGFGYVEFVSAEDAANAYEAKKGFELDGRAMNLDWASTKPKDDQRQENRRKSYGDQLSEPTDTLFVGNLSFDVGQEQVSESFTPYGTIMSVRLPTDQSTGSLKGFGYVTFSSVEEASSALEAMQGAYISNRPVRLDYSQPRPPREDGGFGGRGGGRGFGGRGGGRGFGDRGGRGGRGGFGDRGRGGRGGFGGRGRGAPRGTTNRGGFGDFSGQKKSFD